MTLPNPFPAANSRGPFVLGGCERFAAPWLRPGLAPRRLWLRETVDTDAKEMTKNNLNFYARYYPGISEARAAEISDERLRNVVEVTEHYQIKDCWGPEKSTGRLMATFYPESLENVLPDPDTRLRTMPLAFKHPCRREQEVIVHLPSNDWDLEPEEKSVNSDAFSFSYRRRGAGHTVHFYYQCETKAAFLPAEKVAAYRNVPA